MKDELIAPARPLLRVLSFAVACVLLVACANVVNLLLAGAASRQREMATRLALGARPRHLFRQTMIESVLLALAGGLLGIPLAYWGTRFITRLAPADLPRMQEVGLNVPLLLYALALAAVAGVAAGLLPALRMTIRSNLDTLLRHGSASAINVFGFGGFGLRRPLVVGEIALAVILLAGAGLLARSFVSLSSVEPGYDARDVLTFQVIAPAGHDSIRDFYADVMRNIGSVPGVAAAGATDVLPIAGASSYRLVLGGLPTPPGPGDSMVMRLVSPDYFRAMGIRIVAGRSFSDGANAAREVVLNQEFSRRYFGNANPVGRTVGQGFDTYEVVGIAADVRHEGLHAQAQPEYFVDIRHSAFTATIRPYFVVRSARPRTELLTALRAAVRQLDTRAGVAANVSAMADIVSESVSRPRFNAAILSAFAAIAIVLAAIAVYGVMAYAVTQRTREIGVRVALGARRADVMRLVFGQSAVMTGGGIVLGLAGAVTLTRYLQSMLFGVTPLDAVTFVTVPLAFAAVAAVASCVPAYRATRVDPILALRADP